MSEVLLGKRGMELKNTASWFPSLQVNITLGQQYVNTLPFSILVLANCSASWRLKSSEVLHFFLVLDRLAVLSAMVDLFVVGMVAAS